MTKLLKFGMRNHVLYYILLSTVYLQVAHSRGTGVAVNKVCTKQECKNLADFYKNIINPRGNPCNDFYDYVCHGWGAANPIPQGVKFWSDEKLLKLNAQFRVKKLLEDKTVSSVKDEENAKSLYKACMSLPFRERASSASVKNIKHTVGNWPMFISNAVLNTQNITWQYCEEKYINIAGESSLFDYYLRVNEQNGFRIVPFLRKLYSPYGILKRERDWNDRNERNSYKAFLSKIVDAVAPLDPKEYKKTINQDLDDVITFREKLRSLSGIDGSIELQKVAEFQDFYNRFGSSTNTGKIDWLKMIRSMYKDSKDYRGNGIESTTVIQVQMQYFSKLAALLKDTPSRVIANHVHLYFAERHLLLTEDMKSELQKTRSEIRQDEERWKTCISSTEMDDTLGRMYVHSHFPKGHKLSVTGMVVDASLILQKQISESTWVDPLLAEKWEDKLDHIETQIGYPSWYDDKSGASGPGKGDIDPLDNNVQYIQRFNRIGLSASYLQSPTYDPNLPFAIRYGTLMSTIGHELYHTINFNDLNRTVSILKVASKQQKMIQKLEKQVQCFTDQYSRFKQEVVKKRKLSSNKNSRPTKNEDIADVMGLKLAYRGLKNRLSIEDCTTLPGFEEFSCERLFFIAYAKKYCADLTPAEFNALAADVHSLPEVRVNGAVANMEEFSHAFKCHDGDALKLKKTCDLWRE